eukprot:TRINITY_DN2271_c0_g1_i2.p1 TRINITY_DN2271_c0_g1~~TRINITY_DN2271_c0_g1_i2.p1  ORF type:complete len:308 (+),score=67.75 TRINITY_DN2271_c0_g1_i2:388-1311(+)
MVVGAVDTGKSSLCRLLCNYATRREEQVTFVDIDVGQGQISLPGVVSAIALERPFDIEDGWGFAPSLSYFYGHSSPGVNDKLYRVQLKNLANMVQKRLENNAEVAPSGIIINTCGWVDDVGYELLIEAIDCFVPDIILVMSQERLFADLQKEVDGRDIQVVKLSKSGGVLSRSTQYRRKTRISSIKEYFYGRIGDLCPHSTLLHFSDITILKTSVGPRAPSSALPIGMQSLVDDLRPVEVAPSEDMVHSVLGVSHSNDAASVLETNVAGFIYITGIDMRKRTFTVLAPCTGALPGRFLILGNIKYLE